MTIMDLCFDLRMFHRPPPILRKTMSLKRSTSISEWYHTFASAGERFRYFIRLAVTQANFLDMRNTQNRPSSQYYQIKRKYPIKFQIKIDDAVFRRTSLDKVRTKPYKVIDKRFYMTPPPSFIWYNADLNTHGSK
jgi:hypothetical protein